MKLSLGFSPCPNDTFLFDAMIHHKIDTEGLEWEVALEDVEALNQKAFRNALHITKLSYHAFVRLTKGYILLNSGSALGNNCGPLLIAKKHLSKEAIKSSTIAIPGQWTTANFLLSLAYPNVKQKEEMLFSTIEQAVLDGKVGAGLIIHENRFTYAEKGLVKLIDLGEYWENQSGLPIPLGGIVIQRSLPVELQQKVDRVLRRSVSYAMEYPKSSGPFVQQHAQEMEESVMHQHIQLYVNDYTIDLGIEGRKAVRHLFDMAKERKIISEVQEPLFVPLAD